MMMMKVVKRLMKHVGLDKRDEDKRDEVRMK